MENWIDVKGYEGYYQVSDLGNVKRLAGSPRCKKDRLLKQSVSSNGYLFVTLNKDGARKITRIHRLVMENFCPVEGMENLDVNHIDEDITNNKLSNLQWLTHQENLNYGNRAKKYGISRGHKIKCVETGIIYDSLREAERETGCAHTHISDCVRGKQKTCGGYHWVYAEPDDLTKNSQNS